MGQVQFKSINTIVSGGDELWTLNNLTGAIVVINNSICGAGAN